MRNFHYLKAIAVRGARQAVTHSSEGRSTQDKHLYFGVCMQHPPPVRGGDDTGDRHHGSLSASWLTCIMSRVTSAQYKQLWS